MAKFNLKSLQTRAASASVLIPAVLFAVIWGGLPFFAMVIVLGVISLHEAFDMAKKTTNGALYASLGALYVLLGFVFCVFIREEQSFSAAVLFLLMVWSADIGAYFSGKFIGGAKMAPLVSPNKTWAGLGGACFFAGIVGVIFFAGHTFYNPEGVWSVSALSIVFVLGLVMGVVGQAGDLLVSMMKRIAGVKDTGTLIPGHGGLLDRIDSMLLSAPVFYLALRFFSVDF